ncbi:hypothetical protein V5F38_18530 [Xanthobacter sp. V0B-10]|uniref:hypothetical protein n=1 Tax=Xanthobacter albus TaxID=3119929 RepID=UPI003726C58D
MLRLLIALAWLVALALDAPGHLSTDSVIQLLEGRTGIYAGSNPPLMSALLGAFDRIVPGTALYVLFVSALFYVPLMVLAGGAGRRSAMNWLSGALLLVLLSTPLLLIYQGTVWKDVLFANLSLSTFTCLVLAQRHGGRRRARLTCLALAALLAALAAATRQNGVLIGLAGAACVAITAPGPATLRARSTRMVAWAVCAALAFVAARSAVEASAAQPIGDGMAWGLKVLHRYDMAGMIANGAPPLPASPASSPESQRIVSAFRHGYDPSRVDTLVKNVEVMSYFQDMEQVPGLWWHTVEANPRAWLAHRAAVFRWMVAPPDVRLCLPVWVGVDGPDATLSQLGLKREVRPQDAALYAYSTSWFGTPLFMNLTWALVALALAGVIRFRTSRAPGDVAIVAMLVSGLLFAASFALIGIACDVRYLFLLPVVCCGALAHLANATPQDDPGGTAGPAPSGASVGQ